MNWLDSMSKDEKEAWSEIMIHHAYDEQEWKDAYDQLIILLTKDEKKATAADIRSYLSCCAESAGSVHPLPLLSELVEDLYQAYGMESSQPES